MWDKIHERLEPKLVTTTGNQTEESILKMAMLTF